MKKQHSLFMLTMLALLALSCLTVHAEVVTRVKGRVVSGNASEVLLRWMVDNPITGKGETYRATIGSDGAFSMDVPLEWMATGRVHIGTVSASYGGVSYETVHKPGVNIGSGFGMSGYSSECDSASIDKIHSCVHSFRPYWVTGERYNNVKKWESWDKFQQEEKILNYFEV